MKKFIIISGVDLWISIICCQTYYSSFTIMLVYQHSIMNVIYHI